MLLLKVRNKFYLKCLSLKWGGHSALATKYFHQESCPILLFNLVFLPKLLTKLVFDGDPQWPSPVTSSRSDLIEGGK